MNYSKIIKDTLIILLGTFIYAFGLIYFNIPNQLAEGGVTGITLIFRALFGINPALSTLVLNIPIVLLGGKILGRRSFVYTIIGTVALSGWLFFWQHISFAIDIDHDLLIAALLAGLFAGFGSGIIYRVGGTTGGSDVLARILEQKYGISMGRSLLIFDIFVLTASLTYIDLKRMMYTLIFSYVFSRIVDTILDGGYSAKGVLIISDHTDMLTPALMVELQRGVSYIKGEGAYSGTDKNIIYMVVSASEISEVKRIVHEYDERAFVSIINVHEVEGEGFTYMKPRSRLLKRKQPKITE
ncbi:YitT family protein [Enterococcus mediterraneensis]|uniref:YitT family protein n=1 Tax=Enterococcus mediterraneensis TaxID=2364791 RepID=UPI000F05171D|nr:YitT family protein [Enterococcus mediterraneensis]